MRFILPFIGLMTFAMRLSGQQTAPGFHQTRLTNENGLPSNGIKGLAYDDSTGFLWIGTEAGLVRYDGIHLKLFDNSNLSGFGSGRVVFTVKNSVGEVFALPSEGQLMKIHHNLPFRCPLSDSAVINHYERFSHIAASPAFFEYARMHPWPHFDYPELDGNSMLYPGDSSCYVNAFGRLFFYHRTMTHPQPVATPAAVRKLFSVGQQHFAWCEDGAIYPLLPGGQQLGKRWSGSANTLLPATSQLLWQTGMSQPVVVVQDKAFLLELAEENCFRLRQVAAGVPNKTVFKFAQYLPAARTLALGSISKGVYLVHQHELVTRLINTPAEYEANSTSSQLPLRNGNIMTDRGHIIGDAKRENDAGIGKGFLNNLFTFNDGSILFHRNDSFFRYDRYREQRRLIMVKKQERDYALAQVGETTYFCNWEGLATLDSTNQLRYVWRWPDMPLRLAVYDMLSEEQGSLVIAANKGLFRFDLNTGRIDTLMKDMVFRTLHREGEYLFAGTYGNGYYLLHHNIIRPMPLDPNQYLRFTHCFMPSDDGFCWISTNNGLFKASISDMITAFNIPSKTIYYHYFGRENGMESSEMNGGCLPCAIRMEKGLFSFPSMSGLVQFDPAQVKVSLPDGPVYVDALAVDNQEWKALPQQPLIQLPANTGSIDIDISFNGWCRQQNVYLVYQIDGGHWLPVLSQQNTFRIGLNNLSPGNHQVVIRKNNGFGIDNFSYSRFHFQVAQPFYRTWWFAILLIAIASTLVYCFLQWRLFQYKQRDKKLSALIEEKTRDLNKKNEHLEKNDQIKTRLISIINHDVITPLRFMHSTGRILVDNKARISQREREQSIADITQTARDVEALSSQILNWIIYQDPDKRMQKEIFNMHNKVNTVFRVLNAAARNKGIALVNEVPQSLSVYQYKEAMRVMLYNLVSNSLGFTASGSITVRVHQQKEELHLSVIDTGTGMTAAQVSQVMGEGRVVAAANLDQKKGTGLGFLIIRDLLKIMGGSMEVQSERGKGTRVDLFFPLPFP